MDGRLITLSELAPPAPGARLYPEEWRAERRREPPTLEFCALCWGAGRILEPAPNGEGLVPRSCTLCGGMGRVASRR